MVPSFVMQYKIYKALTINSPFQVRVSAPFTLLIVFEPRNPAFDRDYRRYGSYLALHVEENRAWFTVKLNSQV